MNWPVGRVEAQTWSPLADPADTLPLVAGANIEGGVPGRGSRYSRNVPFLRVKNGDSVERILPNQRTWSCEIDPARRGVPLRRVG